MIKRSTLQIVYFSLNTLFNFVLMMTEKDIKSLNELLKSKMREKVTPEKALESLMSAGILDENGDYTPPFQQLLDEAMVKE